MTSYRNPVLSRIPDYHAGKPIEELARERGVSDIIKLASNENPLGPSPRALAALNEAIRAVHIYPDNDARSLAEAIGARIGARPDALIFGTGSDDIMHLAAWAFGRPGSDALVPDPGFLGYPIFAESFGVRAVPVALSNDRWNLDAFLAAANAQDVSLIFLASPNNPTGTGFTHREVENFMAALPGHITVILDLAYAEFDDDPDAPRMVDLVGRFENVIACRTFSKAYGLAGVRLGYGLARCERILDMKKLRTPFAANGPALAAALAAIEDTDHLARSIEVARTGVRWWTDRLTALGLNVTPSRANFVMVRLGRNAGPVYEALLDRGIIVRRLAAFGLPDALRITAGTAEQNTRALVALTLALNA